jgi:HlyD family secretion protein
MTVSAHRLPRAARLVFTMTVLACLSAVARAQAPEAASKAASTAARPALVVNVATPTRGELAERLGANGSIAAWQEASVGAEIAGLRLAEVLVDVGDRPGPRWPRRRPTPPARGRCRTAAC